MTHKVTTRIIVVLALVFSALLVGACEKDPHDVNTWIPKLDSGKTVEEAVTNLDRLKDLRAIKPLGEAWKKHAKSPKILRAIISISQFNDPSGEKAFIKRTPDYTDAVPYLIEALEGYDPGDPKSIDDAKVAAEALGKSKSPDAVGALVAAAKKPLPKGHPALNVKRSAVLALGGFKDPRAVDTLIAVLLTDPSEQPIQLNAAAAIALGETADPKALGALSRAAFGPTFAQVRMGFSRLGKDALPVALDIYNGKQADVLALAKEKKWPEKTSPGLMQFIGAMLLGDLRAKQAVPQLIADLKKDPIAISPDSPQPTNHSGIVEALRLIGGPEATEALYAYMTDPKTDIAALGNVINAYSMVATDTKALPFLEKLIMDETHDDAGLHLQARIAAAMAYARLGRTAADMASYNKILEAQVKRGTELDAAIKNEKGGEGKFDDAKVDNEGLVPVLKESVARLEIGVKCEAAPDKVACYLETLTAKDLQPKQPGLPRAERAMLELAKMGEKASGALDTLLQPKNAGSGERFVRLPLLMALTRIAALPCDKCATKLKEVLDAQANQTTMDDLNRETRLVYNWFLWAGK